jgi:putative transposase
MPSSHIAAYFHIVFSTKDRQPLLAPGWEARLHAYSGGIIKGLDAVPLEIGGFDDHVHILVSLKSKHRLDYFIRDMKADSSIFIRNEFDPSFEWQKGYGAFSVSPTALPAVRRYIADQRQHHGEQDFKSEFRSLLSRAGIEFDEKYLW